MLPIVPGPGRGRSPGRAPTRARRRARPSGAARRPPRRSGTRSFQLVRSRTRAIRTSGPGTRARGSPPRPRARSTRGRARAGPVASGRPSDRRRRRRPNRRGRRRRAADPARRPRRRSRPCAPAVVVEVREPGVLDPTAFDDRAGIGEQHSSSCSSSTRAGHGGSGRPRGGRRTGRAGRGSLGVRADWGRGRRRWRRRAGRGTRGSSGPSDLHVHGCVGVRVTPGPCAATALGRRGPRRSRVGPPRGTRGRRWCAGPRRSRRPSRGPDPRSRRRPPALSGSRSGPPGRASATRSRGRRRGRPTSRRRSRRPPTGGRRRRRADVGLDEQVEGVQVAVHPDGRLGGGRQGRGGPPDRGQFTGPGTSSVANRWSTASERAARGTARTGFRARPGSGHVQELEEGGERNADPGCRPPVRPRRRPAATARRSTPTGSPPRARPSGPARERGPPVRRGGRCRAASAARARSAARPQPVGGVGRRGRHRAGRARCPSRSRRPRAGGRRGRGAGHGGARARAGRRRAPRRRVWAPDEGTAASAPVNGGRNGTYRLVSSC